MNVIDITGFITNIVTIFTLLLGGWLAVYVFFQLTPVLHMRIIPRWEGKSKDYLIISFEIENKSRIRLYNPQIRLQMLEHLNMEENILSEWIPFDKQAINPKEQPYEWREPEKIFTTTSAIFGGEIISGERLYYCPRANVIMHIGLEITSNLKPIYRLGTGGKRWRQTATCFIVK